MRARNKWWLLVAGVVLFAGALAGIGLLAAGVSGAEGGRAAQRVSGPLAVVLLPALDGSELAVVDLAAGRVARRIRLRSLATDIALDASSGLVVAAQSGGIGQEADDALSITDPRGGEPRYVTLPVSDPGDVACLGGRAFVLHSVLEAAGSVVSVVDVASGRVAMNGNIADGFGLWSVASGSLWTTTGREGEAPALTRIDEETLGAEVVLRDGAAVFGITESAGRLALLGSAEAGDAPGEGIVRLLDAAGASVETSTRSTQLSRAPRQAVAVGERLIVGDWNGDEPEGRVLEVLDASTLRSMGEVRLDGVPCAMAAWHDRLLVVDRKAGRLLVVDPVTGRTLASIDLGVRDLVFSDVVVAQEAGDAD